MVSGRRRVHFLKNVSPVRWMLQKNPTHPGIYRQHKLGIVGHLKKKKKRTGSWGERFGKDDSWRSWGRIQENMMKICCM
jgi:hypothetical protein